MNVLNVYWNQCLKFHNRNHLTEFSSRYHFSFFIPSLYGKTIKKRIDNGMSYEHWHWVMLNIEHTINEMMCCRDARQCSKWKHVEFYDDFGSKSIHTTPKRIFHQFLYTLLFDRQECIIYRSIGNIYCVNNDWNL